MGSIRPTFPLISIFGQKLYTRCLFSWSSPGRRLLYYFPVFRTQFFISCRPNISYIKEHHAFLRWGRDQYSTFCKCLKMVEIPFPSLLFLSFILFSHYIFSKGLLFYVAKNLHFLFYKWLGQRRGLFSSMEMKVEETNLLILRSEDSLPFNNWSSGWLNVKEQPSLWSVSSLLLQLYNFVLLTHHIYNITNLTSKNNKQNIRQRNKNFQSYF